MNDATRRALRTLIQLVAGGGLAWLTDQLAHDLPAAYVPYMMGVYTVIVALAQNYLEDNVQQFPALLKAPASSGENPVPDPK